MAASVESSNPTSAPGGPCPVALSRLQLDGVARVVDVTADDEDAMRLKSLGFCVGRRVQLVKSGDPLVVRVLGARVGLSARLAERVSVVRLS